MEFYNSQKEKGYSKITSRETLWVAIFFSVLGLSAIAFSIHDFTNDQFHGLGRYGSFESRAEYPIYFWVANLIHFAFGVLILFFVRLLLLYRKRMNATVSDQLKALEDIGEHEHFRVSSTISADMQSKEEEFPLVAKAVLGFFLLLVAGVGLFAFTILCRLFCNSVTERLNLALIIGSLAVLIYFITLANPIFLKKNEKGEIKIRRLTVTEQIIALVAIISLCAGVVLWYFH